LGLLNPIYWNLLLINHSIEIQLRIVDYSLLVWGSFIIWVDPHISHGIREDASCPACFLSKCIHVLPFSKWVYSNLFFPRDYRGKKWQRWRWLVWRKWHKTNLSFMQLLVGWSPSSTSTLPHLSPKPISPHGIRDS